MELAPVNSNTVKALAQEGVDVTALPSDETVKNATQAVAPLLRGNVDVTASQGTNTTREIDVPELDEALNGSSESLDKLIALLTLESDESQIEAAKDRLESMLKKLDSEQQKVLQKLSEALEEAKEVEKAQKKAEALGWLMLGLAVIATVITSVATFGAGTAGALAIVGCVCSIAATTLTAANQIATACGGKEACVDKRTEEIMEKEGCSRKEAKEKAEKEWDMGWGIATGILSLAALACGIGEITQAVKAASKAAAKAAEEAAKKAANVIAKEATAKATGLASKSVQAALKIAGTSVQLVSAGIGVGQAVIAFEVAELIRDQGKAAAELAELQAVLDQIQEAVEEQEEALKQLLLNLQSAYAALAEVMNAGTDTISAMLNMFQNGAGAAV